MPKSAKRLRESGPSSSSAALTSTTPHITSNGALVAAPTVSASITSAPPITTAPELSPPAVSPALTAPELERQRFSFEALETPTCAPCIEASEADYPHFCCTVCLSFPDKEVFQCHNGHIVCHSCFDRVSREEQPKCPTCREPFDLMRPIRNVLAEQSIAQLPVKCPNLDCTVQLTRASLSAHLANECPCRQLECKFCPIGCKWVGLASAFASHVESCKKAEMPGWKVLKRVRTLNKVAEERHAKALAEYQGPMAICQMLSSRCRNIEVVQVQLHRCAQHEHVGGSPAHLAAPTFHVLGFRWKLYTLSEVGTGKYSAVLQLRGGHVAVPADFFIVAGQQHSDPSLKVACGSHTFSSPRTRTSEPVIIAEGAAAESLSSMETLSLRLGIVDRRTGKERGFLGHSNQISIDEGWEDEEAEPMNEGQVDNSMSDSMSESESIHAPYWV